MNMNIVHELKEIDNSILMIGGEKEKDIKTMLFFPKLSRKELDEMKELVKYQEKFIKLKYGL